MQVVLLPYNRNERVVNGPTNIPAAVGPPVTQSWLTKECEGWSRYSAHKNMLVEMNSSEATEAGAPALPKLNGERKRPGVHLSG